MTNLKIIRKHNKMTQQQVSSLLGISRSTYTQYETNVSQPDFKTINALKNIFQVPTDFLLENPPFDRFSDIIQHFDLLVLSIEKLLSDNLKFICPEPYKNLSDFITLMSITIKKIEIETSDEKPHLTIFPLLPLEDLAQIFSVVSPNTPEQTDHVSPQEKTLLSNFHALNEQGQEKVCEYAADLNASGRYKKCSEPNMVQNA